MGNCYTCGKPAGFGNAQHPECREKDPAPFAVKSVDQHSDLVAQLTPILMKAATRAGLVGAFTMAGISIGIVVIFRVVAALTSLPTPSH